MGMESVYRLSVMLGMTDQLTSPMRGVQSSVESSLKTLDNAFGSMQKAGAVMAGVGTGILGAAYSTVAATFDTQNALGELASLGVEDLKAVEDAAKSFSDTWAGTTKSDFISASYDIKSGIASLSDEGIAQYTELAGMTAKATKSTIGEMTSLFATAYGIYKGSYEDMSDLDFGEMFSSGISTAVKNYKTAGSEMASAISMLGATATNNRISMEEQLAILGQLQTTMSGSEAATKYKSFLNTAAKAGKTLKLSFLDAENNMKTMPEILNEIRGKYGDTLDAIEKQQLKEAFGTDEAIALIDLLYNNVETLETGISDLKTSMDGGISTTMEMATAINSMPEQKFEVLKQKLHNNIEILGAQLLPTLNNILDKGSQAIDKFSTWASENQETIQTVMMLTLKVGAFLVILGGLIGGIGTVGKAIISFRTGIQGAKEAFGAFKTVMSAGAGGPVVIGILALVAAFVYLWNTSENFRNFWIGLFNQIQGKATEAWGRIQPSLESFGAKFHNLMVTLQPVGEVIATIFGVLIVGAIGLAVGVLEGLLDAAAPVIDMFGFILEAADNFIKGFVTLSEGDADAAFDFFLAGIDNINNAFESGFDAILSFAGGFADGFLDVVGGALDACGINVSGDIEQMKSDICDGLAAAKENAGIILDGLTEYTKFSLTNMKNAYTEAGGGFNGIMAAALTGIKDTFKLNYDIIDNMTNGKLTAIKNAFINKMNEAKEAVHNAIQAIKDKFNFQWSLPALKLPHVKVTGGFSFNPPSAPKFNVDWYAKGGIMTRPTLFGMNGGSLLGGGEAGAEAILPLAVLWEKMSGIISGLFKADEEKRERQEGTTKTLWQKETKTIQSSTREYRTWKSQESVKGSGNKGIHIGRLNISVDISRIKDIDMLYKLIDELKDSTSGDEDELEDVVVE